MADKLNVAFLWHMHQPYYRNPASGKYVLPWVRLHGIKGYADMLAAVRNFGSVQVTFNFVPCLVKQLDDLAGGNETDLYFDLSAKPAETLESAEKEIILKDFFSANWENMVLKYPRYRDLLNKRGRRPSDSDFDSAMKGYTVQDWRDLQVWFNLTWFGWAAEKKYPLISELRRKDRDFSEDEKTQVLDLQLKVLKQIIPDYRTYWEQSQIEISTSPFYHPILPLVIDSGSARISQPKDSMPGTSFKRPDDARQQMQMGLRYIEEQFGRVSAGLWPSEGSVSPAVCELAGECGIQWLATDENVLLATLGNADREKSIYQPYLAYENGPTLVFRDHFLSDAIGFRYARNTPEQSVNDLLGNLENIAASQGRPESKIVPIILDGENAWEYFPDGGFGFFQLLYARLSDHPRIQTTTIGDFIKRNPAETILPPIFPASWIRGSFRIWIGDPIKNSAWDKLSETAHILDDEGMKESRKSAIERARQWLYVAEGSDWFWWYGEPNHSYFEKEFDLLFRSNLMQVYRELGLDVPEDLLKPLTVELAEEEVPLFPMKPVIDGRETNFYEWVGARVVKASDFSGSMNFESGLLERLHYGFSQTHLFFRMDPAETFGNQKNLKIIIQFSGPKQPTLEISRLQTGQKPEVIYFCEPTSQKLETAAFDRILEVAIPFEIIPRMNNEILFAVILKKGSLEIERWPHEGSYVCPWPTEEYLMSNWVI